MVRIQDVAEACGTSIATVSHVLNGTKAVRPELAARVREAVRSLGYEANPLARSLKSRRSHTIGLLVTNIDRIFFSRVIRGVQEVLLQAGYQLTIGSTGDSLEREKTFFHTFQGRWTDGILVDSTAGLGDEAWLAEMANARVGQRKLPVVGLERRLDAYGMDSVGIDNRQAARDATRFLLDRGCVRIAHLAGVATSPLAVERMEGFLETAGDRAGGVETGDFSPVSGYDAMKRLLRAGPPPDGLFAANDQMAVGALQALEEAGLRVPDDIRVMGFDDTFVASLVRPTLGTVHAPKLRLGVRAARRLLRRIEGDDSPAAHELLPHDIVDRESTGNRLPGERDMTAW